MDKVSARDVAKLISENTGVAARQVTNISMHEKFCFIEVPKEKTEAVMDGMQSVTFKGRRVAVDKASRISKK